MHVFYTLQKQSKAQKRREKAAAKDAEREARIAAGAPSVVFLTKQGYKGTRC